MQLLNSSDSTMRTVELFEIQTEEGPCLDCFNSGVAVVNADLASGGRWPRFAPVAVVVGYRAVDAVPMRLRGQVIGALNLSRKQVGALSDDDVAMAQAFADVATIAILQYRSSVEAQVLNPLQTALTSRIVLEQAKGTIAERQQLSMDAAFDRLRRYARDRNLRLADVAEAVVYNVLELEDLNPPLDVRSNDTDLTQAIAAQ